jgi:hypothetical protein
VPPSLLCAALCLGCGDDPRACPNDLPDGAVCPSYQNDIVPIIMAKCYPCHGPGGVEQLTHDFTKWSVINAQRTDVLGQIHACNMPPITAPNGDLTAMERFLFQSWLICHAPNN